MKNVFGIDDTEPDDSFTSKHYLSGWCPECGRRRGVDARCKNCDPWWTSPLVQAGVPAVLGVLVLLTSAATFTKQTQKPHESTRSVGTARLITVKVERPNPGPQIRTAPVLSSVVVPTVSPTAETLRVQREGAYINAVLRAQDEERRSQQFAARHRAYAFALQQRMQAISQMRAQSRRSLAAPAVPRGNPVTLSPARLEQVMTEETIVVPL